MNLGLVFSISLHAVVLVLAVFGLPRLARDEPIENRLVVVDVVTVAEVTNAPPPAEVAKPDDTPPPPPEAAAAPDRAPPPPPAKAAPPPPPAKAAPPPPAAAAEAPPKPPVAEPAQVAAAEPVPLEKPAPAPEAVPVPVEKPEPPKPEPPQQVAVAPPPEPVKAEPAKADPPKPESATVERVEPEPPAPIPVARPTPPKPRPEQVAVREVPPTPETKPTKSDSFLNVLKTVQQLNTEAPKRPSEAPPKPAPDADNTARRAVFDPNQALSVSEMDAIRQQIGNCWLVPAGAKDAADLEVMIDITMNQDRTVRFAEVVDRARMMSDPFFRAAAEAALRALKSPACSPLQLPPEKYETWKRLEINFNPKDMLR